MLLELNTRPAAHAMIDSTTPRRRLQWRAGSDLPWKRTVSWATRRQACERLGGPNATTLGGPTGTGFYGRVDRSPSGTSPAWFRRKSAARRAPALVQCARTTSTRRRGLGYSGPSWATNPPAPAQ